MLIIAQLDPESKNFRSVTNTPEHIEAAIELTIKHLGTTPNLYYLHRRDPKVPVEQSFGTLDKIRRAGKTRYIGVCECSAETLREACKGTYSLPATLAGLMSILQ